MKRYFRYIVATVVLSAAAVCTLPLRADDAPKPDHSKVPGTVVAYSPAASGIYIGSPGIVILPDGTYLAKHDEFGPKSTEKTNAITHVYRSKDRGQSWEHIARVEHAFWVNIFYHEGAVYMMGGTAGHRHGHCAIRKSVDGGCTWTEAKDENSGLLFGNLSYHTAPMPMVVHDGRIWRAMEDEQGGTGWGNWFRAFVMSAPVDADLLKASNWIASNRVARDGSWLGGRFGGWLEGNAVLTPEGRIVDILRVAGVPEKAAIVQISQDGKTASFDPENGFVDFPGGGHKFTIRYDAKSNAYWSLSNPSIGGSFRNTLALLRSKDLVNWEMRCILVHHPDRRNHGFQYPDWVFDGDDMIAAIRTAYDDGVGGAHNAHDANYLTFHRFKNFRDLTMADSVVQPDDIGPGGPAKLELGDLTVEGRAFAQGTLDNGAEAFGNRNYVWEKVPEKLQGWLCTKTLGGVPARMRVTAKRDAVLHMATAAKRQSGIDTTGWEPETELDFGYTDGGHTTMQVFRRVVKAGESLDIPQGNWTGGILLVPPKEAK